MTGHNRWLRRFIMVIGMAGISPLLACGEETSASSSLTPPVRLQADGKVIDTGKAWGHSAPSMVDIDGDGLLDLIVGDFSGKFHHYRNVGTVSKPVFASEGFLQAGGEDAHVHIYCCIGSQARFGDLNGDGIQDMIANSYDPGHCYAFWGRPGNQFAAREELLDISGVPVRSSPQQTREVQSFGSFYELVDWDGDGDLDLLIGCFEGVLKLRLNEGSKTEPAFASQNIDVTTEAGLMRVKAHFCPRVADWDGDGLWDILAGSDDGSVTWFRNIGEVGAPRFANGELLVEPHDGNGFNLVQWEDDDVVPGVRTQIDVVDFDGDGKLDLLVGDMYTAYEFKEDLLPEQKKAIDSIHGQLSSAIKVIDKRRAALQATLKERFPGDLAYSDEATSAWNDQYTPIRESPEAKEIEVLVEKFSNVARPYMVSGDSKEDLSRLAKSHGYVWLFLRK